MTHLVVNTTGKGKTYEILSTCPYRMENMLYGKALNGTSVDPCTNVPIHCLIPGCKSSAAGTPKTIWKYNALYHIVTEHASPDGSPPVIPPQMMIQLFIHQAEEDILGIPETYTHQWRATNDIPGSDDLEIMAKETQTTSTKGRTKRDRAETIRSSDKGKKRKPA